MSKLGRQKKIELLYLEYMQMRGEGYSHEVVISHFTTFLHPTLLSMLKKRLERPVGGN